MESSFGVGRIKNRRREHRCIGGEHCCPYNPVYWLSPVAVSSGLPDMPASHNWITRGGTDCPRADGALHRPWSAQADPDLRRGGRWGDAAPRTSSQLSVHPRSMRLYRRRPQKTGHARRQSCGARLRSGTSRRNDEKRGYRSPHSDSISARTTNGTDSATLPRGGSSMQDDAWIGRIRSKRSSLRTDPGRRRGGSPGPKSGASRRKEHPTKIGGPNNSSNRRWRFDRQRVVPANCAIPPPNHRRTGHSRKRCIQYTTRNEPSIS